MMVAFVSAETAPRICRLEHRLFTIVRPVLFQKDETDGTPVMIVDLGGQIAALPLGSIRREFGIADDSVDGRMLILIVQSLEFVNGLCLGDPLPSEVLDGGASWQPDEGHRSAAEARLRTALIRWCGMALGGEMGDLHVVENFDTDPRLRALVQQAFDEAAHELGLSGSGEVVRRVERLADELASIEALRDRLLRRAMRMSGKLDHVSGTCHGAGDKLDSITQVRRLTRLGLKAIHVRFEEVDAQTTEIVSALRDLDGQVSFIRFNRDWLYRGQRAWDPVLTEWESADASLDEAMWQLIARTYRFLAPRFMPVQEWQSMHAGRAKSKAQLLQNAMRW